MLGNFTKRERKCLVSFLIIALVFTCWVRELGVLLLYQGEEKIQDVCF